MNHSAHHNFGTLGALLGLFRPDAAAISFLSYLVGILMGGGKPGLPDIGVATLITLISTNFIYSYNCLEDREEDRIGHPDRPLPSGRLKPGLVRGYSFFLLIGAVSYPFLLDVSELSRGLMLFLPLLGILYSAPPLRLRSFPLPATLIICAGLVTPITLGLLESEKSLEFWPISAGLFLFCCSAVPLKSLEEAEEAQKTGRANLYLRFGPLLFFYSAAGLLITTAWSALLVHGAMRIFIMLLSSASLLILAIYSKKTNAAGLYRQIIRLVIFLGLVLGILSKLTM